MAPDVNGSTERIAELASALAEATTPAAALRRITELRKELDAFERREVARALTSGSSFAAVARQLGVTRQAVHRRFRDVVGPELALGTAPEVGRVLRFAREEATVVGSRDLRGEHILLAVLRAGDLPAAGVLRDAGVALGRARVHVDAASPALSVLAREAPVSDLRSLLMAPAAEARKRGSRRIEVEHLLLGALEDESGGATRALRALGTDPDAIRHALEERLGAAVSSS
jgi:ATP-dependent Clp protease ATP-binding subunit ClpA